MKKLTTPAGVFGPYNDIEVLEDRYIVDGGAGLPFVVVGQGEISDVLPGDFPPPPAPEPTPEPVPPASPTKEELLAQLQALQAQIEALG